MEYRPYVEEIVDALRELGTEKRRKQSARYFPTAQQVIGVSNPDMKALIKALRAKYPEWEERHWIRLCHGLVQTDIYECQIVAYERIAGDKKLLSVLDYVDVKGLWRNLDNWASVDHYSMGIHGVLWGRGVIEDQDVFGLLDSENVWDRRVAVVSTVALNLASRGGTGDTPRTLKVCRRVVDERHPMIWKALSWALRALSKWDREAVESFLEEHGNRISKQVIREVRHKLDHGTKN
jgi:3-methyladenine DNA glycosylase AlkD